jgi:hypothetical protein
MNEIAGQEDREKIEKGRKKHCDGYCSPEHFTPPVHHNSYITTIQRLDSPT